MWRAHHRSWSAAVLVLAVTAWRPAPGREPARQRPGVPAATLRDGTLSFDGHATTGDFVGTTSRVTGAVLASPDYASVRGWVEAPVATLLTGNGLRDRDLRKSMEVDIYPTMRYDLGGATVRSAAVRSAAGPDSASVVLHGTLRLHGVSRSADVQVVVVRSGDTARVVGTFPLDVTDFRVGGLRKMGGLLRMREKIEVHLALQFVLTK